MASVILYCRRTECGAGYASIGELPAICPSCLQPTRWSTMPPHVHRPQVDGWAPSENDRRMLRGLKIDPD